MPETVFASATGSELLIVMSIEKTNERVLTRALRSSLQARLSLFEADLRMLVEYPRNGSMIRCHYSGKAGSSIWIVVGGMMNPERKSVIG